VARLPRLSVPGFPHLLVQRGVAGQPAFRDEADYQFMLANCAAWADGIRYRFMPMR